MISKEKLSLVEKLQSASQYLKSLHLSQKDFQKFISIAAYYLILSESEKKVFEEKLQFSLSKII